MAVPNVTTRVEVTLFAADLLADNGVTYQPYPDLGAGSLVLHDGGGVRVAVTGDPSSLRLLAATALQQLGPPAAPPPDEPPAAQQTSQEDFDGQA